MVERQDGNVVRKCLIFLYIAVIKTMTKCNLGRTGFIYITVYRPLWREVREGPQNSELGGRDRDLEGTLLTNLVFMMCFVSFYHWSRTYSALGSLSSIINQEKRLWTCLLQSDCSVTSFQLRFPYSREIYFVSSWPQTKTKNQKPS